MTRFVMLCLIALMTCALFGTKLFAQSLSGNIKRDYKVFVA